MVGLHGTACLLAVPMMACIVACMVMRASVTGIAGLMPLGRYR
ncbi:hypothetical protein BIFGAL_02978 [Bifidobacterium gallicum DSM 20093 = LMG 11596]|uniref:Uncharacterized protein n=1 Tax=Bifidobacterium gallicum DSM 20093 = LMG 11596 TaxID=561180 RepID=D1NT67_9BIFI|nr:hypothetical protein BIFGAL_02978 [Bifidobacterium gallicum DSM 20093 = LMG 11596]